LTVKITDKKQGQNLAMIRSSIPDDVIERVKDRDKHCVFCHKKLVYPYDPRNHKECGTLIRLNLGITYDVNKNKLLNIVMCCGNCNSSRQAKPLSNWFATEYCVKNGINQSTVAKPVKDFLKSCEVY
jgi:hypothetical protein